MFCDLFSLQEKDKIEAEVLKLKAEKVEVRKYAGRDSSEEILFCPLNASWHLSFALKNELLTNFYRDRKRYFTDDS